MSTPWNRARTRTPRSAFLPAPTGRLSVALAVALAGTVSATTRGRAAEDPEPAATPAKELLVLGPLPAPPRAPDDPEAIYPADRSRVPEIDTRAPLPRPGEALSVVPGERISWQRRDATGLSPKEPGVYWVATALRLDRWSRVDLRATGPGELELFVDEQHVASRPDAPKSRATALRAERSLARGAYVVRLRLTVPRRAGRRPTVSLKARTTPPAGVVWDLDRRSAPARFGRSAALGSITSVAVSRGGDRIARCLTRPVTGGAGHRTELAVLDRDGRAVALLPDAGSTRPVRFLPRGRTLLCSRRGTGGTDILRWDPPGGAPRTIVAGEPDIGRIRVHPSGTHLLFSSRRGVSRPSAAGSAPVRRTRPRQKLMDDDPLRRLHLVDVATGSRRVIVEASDDVIDDYSFLPDGRHVVWARTRATSKRPWFRTEILSLDLATGRERTIAGLDAGWEVRPQRLVVSPDGKRLAFVGPPGEVGEIGSGRPERNVYNKQLWCLDLGTGTLRRVGDASAGEVHDVIWSGEQLVIATTRGPEAGIARLEPRGDGWREAPLETTGSIGRAAFAPDGSAVVYTASTPTRLPELRLRRLPAGQEMVVERPNARLSSLWRLSRPRDATFEGPGGESIDAWWYAPSRRLDEGKTPLVVYYYGGSSPTLRGFNFTHQWLAANGYAVLVLNPRGAHGRGDAFADHHAGDWGPKAAADVESGVAALLAARRDLDPDRVGIYGGSYGGFLTQYLLTVSDRFAAAVSMYGISDLATYWGQGSWGWTYGDMAWAGRTPWRDPDYFAGHSPLFRADRIHTPLLLLHGGADTNVTPGQSEEMFTALSTLGRTVELVRFPGEDHGISGSRETRSAHRTMLLEWFDRFLRDQPEAWEARWR